MGSTAGEPPDTSHPPHHFSHLVDCAAGVGGYFYKNDKDVNLVKITVKIFGPKYFGLDTYDVITTVLEVRDGATVAEVMDALDRIYPGLKDKLLRNGVVIPMHDIWINGRSIDFLQGLDTVLKEEDVVQIIPPFGG